jgi:hypothetical protein
MRSTSTIVAAFLGAGLLAFAGCSRATVQPTVETPVRVDSCTLEGNSPWGDSRVKLPLSFTVWDKSPVKIVRITHGCACLAVAPNLDGKELSPGSSHTVDVTISVPQGYAQKKAVVELITEPPMPEPLVVSICGTAIGVPSFWPQFVHVESAWGEKPQGVVDLSYFRFPDDPVLTLNKKSSQLGPFVIAEERARTELQADLPGYAKAPQKEHINLSLEIKEPLAIGNYQHELRFVWNQAVSECVVPVVVHVRHPLRPVVDNVDVGKLRPGKTWAMNVPLTPREETKVHIKAVKCEGGAVEAELVKEQHCLALKVTAPAKPGHFENAVLLSFDNPALPELRFPVTGTVDNEKP